jgi:probable HAF family extracellular repeat protein
MKLQPFLAAAFLLPACVLPSAASTTGAYNVTTIYAPNGAATKPAAINSAGQVVGLFYDTSGTGHGFLYQNGASTQIDCPNVQSTHPLAINDSGMIYGTCGSNIFQYVIGTGQLTTAPIQLPAGYSSSTNFTITTISPTGEVFGWISRNAGFQAFEYLYPGGQATFVPQLPASTAYFPQVIAANSAGELVGSASAPFRYLDGVYSQIPQLSSVTGLGPSGQLLGIVSGPTAGYQAAAVYQDGLITLLQLPGAMGLEPTPVAINASGYVVGTYYQATTNLLQGFLAAPMTAPPTEKSTIQIDSPNATSGTLFGSYQLSGWALDNTAGINDINILVDGALIATTTTTIARPDVCAAFPNQSGCPTVGWQYMLDTTALAVGSHTLETVAISNTGQRAKAMASFTVANNSQKASLLKLNIDTPTPQNPVSGRVIISGWAEDPGSYASSITFSIDLTVRSSYYYGTYIPIGISRPDVCAAFPGDLHCPNVGWSYTVDISNLTNGPHTLTVAGYAANGDQTTVTQTFTVANSGALKLFLDQPNGGSGTLSGRTTFSGWAFDPNAHISSVTAVLDGVTNAFPFYGGYRPDVCAATPGGLDCPNVGWSGLLDTTQLANGAHTLSITALAQNNDYFRSQPVSFVVNNPAIGNTTHAFIDTPSSAIQQFWGVTTFSGWAFDDATQLQRIDYFIDGNLSIAPYGGSYASPRPDVCAIYPNRPGCPYIGWNISINTLPLSNGTHTFTMTAVSETNSEATVSSAFTVNNNLGQNGSKLVIDSPAAGSVPLSGQTTFSGWGLSFYNYFSTVSASIDAGPALYATYGLPRPDVCQIYASAPNCPNVGWSLGFDTTQWADGIHRLNVTASVTNPSGSSTGYETTQSVFFTVANSGTSSPIASYIDTPTSATPTLSGVTSFSGWAIDQTTTIANVSITVDGVPFGVATYGGSRPDVCAGFPQYAGCPAGAIGWSFAIDTTTLVNGSHTLAVTSASSDGRYHTITSSFSTGN